MNRFVICFFVLTFFCPPSLAVKNSVGQDELKPGRLSKQIRMGLEPGLLTEYFSSDGKLLDSGTNRLPALFVDGSESLTPFVSNQAVKIRMSGFLKLKLKGSYQFSAVGNGNLKLVINGTTVLDQQGDLRLAAERKLDLVKGYNSFELHYLPSLRSLAQFRIYWKSEEFTREPIPAEVIMHSLTANRGVNSDPVVYDLHRQRQVGRNLVLSHNCLKCHEGRDVNELYQQRDTPDLRISIGRINEDWLEEWLMTPSKLRNEITMPRMFDQNSAQDVVDVTAFLMSGSQSEADSKLSGDVEKGGELFENVGCIGCHHFETPDFNDEYERISLHFAAAKYRPGKLASFLSDSRKHYQWSRMPRFRLNALESQHLEAYIRSESQGKPQGISAEKPDPKRGRAVFINAGCADCHSGITPPITSRETPRPMFVDLKSGSGCLSEEPLDSPSNPRIPDFRFSKPQKQAIGQLMELDDDQKLARFNLSQFTRRQISEMRCTSCHDLDEQQATLPYIIEEEGVVGLPPNRVPMLTFAGEKLLADWSERLISGTLNYRVREHFRVQMPGFPARGKLIAQGLNQMHGFQRDENAPWKPLEKEILEGKMVAAMETGLSCNRCHAIADQKPNAAFDAQSTNLVYATQRLRKEYYIRWMLDPIRIDKQTKMPRFSEDRKTTSLKSVAKGNADRQFESLWQYLNSIQAGK